jgi:hypothetical protein
MWVRNLVSHIKGRKRIRVFDNRVLRKLFGPKRGGRSRSVEKVA